MPLNIDRIANMGLPPIIESYDKKATILYALGLGFGRDPLDRSELPFVYEKDLRAMPSMCNTLCHPGFWAQKPEFGIDWVKILHAEQDFVIHRPMAPTATLRGEYNVTAIEDKGAEKGALLHQQKLLYDHDSNELIATVRSTLFMRGNGGEGSFGDPVAAASPLPDRAPDKTITIATAPGQALIYRLSGDWNPLHADPDIATKAGFPVPILHGLCTNGLAARAILQGYCDLDPARLASMFVRFSRPVYPGETIRFDFFEGADGLRFRATVTERDIVVLDRCSASVK